MSDIALDQIQGNVLGGFLKDHQVNIFLKVTDVTKAKLTFAAHSANDEKDSILEEVKASSSEEVLRFNAQFKALRAQGVRPESVIAATWTNVVFTHSGLAKFNAPGLSTFPRAFIDGMFARASQIGDVGDNAPAKWEDLQVASGSTAPDPHDWSSIDIMIIVASDEPSQVSHSAIGSRVARYLDRLNATNSGVKIIRLIDGETREGDEAGHEHFGFKDGVSQPGVRGVDQPDDPVANPGQGHPGQDLLQPGEFVLGYPRQIPFGTGAEGPNPNPGPIAGQQFLPTDPPHSRVILPTWTNNGSFLVFRRLYQDVAGFHAFVDQTANTLGIHKDLFGAKIVGRYASGAPLEKVDILPKSTTWPPMTDPATAPVSLPALASSETLNNDFEYGDDEDGKIVPRAAHIRKAYPRDEVATGQNETDAESQTQTHRILRRGIPFGESLDASRSTGAESAAAPRGLLFLCYQSDIERQFEFVQKHWVNAKDFPRAADGVDPLINNSTPSGSISGCPFHDSGNQSACPVSIPHFVKTRGGGYFFSPSIAAVQTLFT